MRSRHNPEPADPNALMMRGETEFEEARMRCEFELIFAQISQHEFHSFKEGYEFLFRKAYFTGKAAGKRDHEGTRRELEVKGSPKYPSYIHIL